MSVSGFAPEPFGKYYLLDRIAVGGMAEIFLAKSFAEGGFESSFVVKRILPQLGDDASFVDMFITEAKVTVALQHPNIVRVFDFGKEDRHYFLVMEHIDGRDLRRVLRAAGRAGKALSVPLALHVISEACKGLHYAHTRTRPDGQPVGIVHRDVSPSNLLVSWDGEIKVADFGIARADWVAGEEEGTLKGKFEYMSPEQSEGRRLDATSDVFTLGVVLYELVTGRRAFKGESDAVTLQRLRELKIAPVREVAPRVPVAVAAVIEKALQRDPADRFVSAREMGEAVRASMDGGSHDTLREELSRLVRGLFSEEIAAEHERMAAATAEALALREARAQAAAAGASAAPAAASGVAQPGGASTSQPAAQGGGQPAPAPPPPAPRWQGAAAVIAIGAVLLGVGVLWMQGQQPAAPAVQLDAMGSVEVQVKPAGKVFLSGRLVGEGESVTAKDLAPGEYEVRIEAEGFRTVVDAVKVMRGGATRMVHELQPLSANPPVVQFDSKPAGASVFVAGKLVGITPLAWREGEPGQALEVELRLDGHAPWRGRTGELVAGKEQRVERALTKLASDAAAAPADPEQAERMKAAKEAAAKEAAAKEAAAKEAAAKAAAEKPPPPPKEPASSGGTLKVTLVGPNWATVYVDGKKLAKTAPFSGVPIAAGDHTVVVENPGVGLNHTQRVTVTPGGTATVRVVAQ